MMTDEELDKIKARLAASPGPWNRDTTRARGLGWSRLIFSDEQHLYHNTLKLQVCEASLAGPGYDGDSLKRAEHNADFIMHSHSDVSSLVAEVERLKEFERKYYKARRS